MGEQRFEVRVDPDRKFAERVKKAIEEVGDLTVPFQSITRSWFKTNRAIFSLKSPGKYQDLKEHIDPATGVVTGYKWDKLKDVGFQYPILKRTGRLEKSLTSPASADSIAVILNRTVLLLGTKVPYGPPHQDGAPKIGLPRRPFVLLGPEQVVDGINENNRREAWIGIISRYVNQILKARLAGQGSGSTTPGGE